MPSPEALAEVCGPRGILLLLLLLLLLLRWSCVRPLLLWMQCPCKSVFQQTNWIFISHINEAIFEFLKKFSLFAHAQALLLQCSRRKKMFLPWASLLSRRNINASLKLKIKISVCWLLLGNTGINIAWLFLIGNCSETVQQKRLIVYDLLQMNNTRWQDSQYTVYISISYWEYPWVLIPVNGGIGPCPQKYGANETLMSMPPKLTCYVHLILWHNALIAFSSESDSVGKYWTEVYTTKLGRSQVLEVKDKNIYISNKPYIYHIPCMLAVPRYSCLGYSRLGPQTLQWMDATPVPFLVGALTVKPDVYTRTTA